MIDINKIKLIAFDADDTLWDCQSYYDKAEDTYTKILERYGIGAKEVAESLFETETKNMPLLGYGCKAFILSLIENAVKMTHREIEGKDIQSILNLSHHLLTSLGQPLAGIEDTLKKLKRGSNVPRVVFTKGELLDQKNKYHKSGLSAYFDDIIVVEDKTIAAYKQLCTHFGVQIAELLMIGNSFKSDIEPVLKQGGCAIHIPFHTVWQHEMVEEYPHENLIVLDSFSELTKIIL